MCHNGKVIRVAQVLTDPIDVADKLETKRRKSKAAAGDLGRKPAPSEVAQLIQRATNP